jgi:cytochrome c oxidase subunit 2
MQSEVWWTTLAGIGLVALAFVYVIAKSGKPADPAQVQKTASAIRPWWFLALVVLGIGVAWASLSPFPIPDQQGQAEAQVVNAVARQWSWELSRKAFTAGVPVEFRVTSADVNHGFAIYDPGGRIVTQTQAMPGFTNRLVHTFAQPGKYRVLCLEYCGVAHHGMLAEFEVSAASGSRP